MKKAVVHVRSNAAGKIVREKRDGRETIVIPSFAAKAETVLNGILYTRDELDASIAGLNRTPAPLGHPTLNGKFVPAMDPEALARNHIFAWNESPRWEGDRIALNVVIDEARAKESEGGKKVLNAIETEKPISTSTGLLCNLEEVNADGHKSVARNIEWDHVAILMDEKPAISPEEGVGIFVNSASQEATEIEVINSALSDAADQEIDWAGTRLIEAVMRRKNAGAWEKMKAAILEALGFSERETSTNTKENDMPVTDEQFKSLSDEVKTLSEAMSKIGETVTNAVSAAVKPITDAQAEMVANQKAKDEAELAALRAKIVKANILDEDGAKELTLNAARKLAEKAEPGKATGLNPAFKGNGSEKAVHKAPEGE